MTSTMMVNMQASSKNSDVDFISNKGVSLCKLVHSLDKSILCKAFILNTFEDALQGLGKLMQRLSCKLEANMILGAWVQGMQEKAASSGAAISTAVLGCYAASEYLESEKFKNIFSKGLTLISTNAMKVEAGINLFNSYCSSQIGRYRSEAMKIRATNDTLSPVRDGYSRAMDSGTQTIRSDVEAIKNMVENYGSSKKD